MILALIKQFLSIHRFSRCRNEGKLINQKFINFDMHYSSNECSQERAKGTDTSETTHS